MIWSFAYLGSIVLVNWLFTVLPLVALPMGAAWPPASLAVGFIFVIRDFAQREIGHLVLLVMLVGAALSYLLANPFVAAASVVAFLVSETADWVVFSFYKGSLRNRILWSSVFSTPVDSAVFLLLIGHFSAVGVIAMTLSKLIGALVVWKRLPA